ncbi:MAG: hypothetical protein PHQ86_06935 [Dehalococcoidales bacterium]|nr:hypothetical protein [Dehalococcoidales bacterium]
MNEKVQHKVLASSDPSGVFAAYFISLSLPVSNVEFMFKHGEIKDQSFDMIVDSTPVGDYKGYVFDSHQFKPKDEKSLPYKYKFFETPTAYGIADMFKEKIKQEDLWKVIGACVLEGRYDLISGSILENDKRLLERTVTTYQKYKQETIETFTYPVYLRLSSPITSLCMVNEPRMAFDLLSYVEEPADLIFNKAVAGAKNTINEGVRVAVENSRTIDLDAYAFMVIQVPEKFSDITQIRMEDALSYRLMQKMNKTVAVYNPYTRRGSVSGPLSLPILKALIDKKKAYGYGKTLFSTFYTYKEELSAGDINIFNNRVQ